MPIFQAFLLGIVGSFAAALVAGIIAIVKTLIWMRVNIAKLVDSDDEQNRALQIIARIQHPQLVAHKATLEALKGECNGNVDHAHEMIMKATEEYNAFLVERI